MQTLRLVPDYLVWHYSGGFRFAWNFARNIIRTAWGSFSLSLIFKTFFSPWKRMKEGYIRSDPASWISTFIFNSLMRGIGMTIRLFVVIIGTITIAVSLCLSLALLIVWAILPFVILTLLIIGIKELFI